MRKASAIVNQKCGRLVYFLLFLHLFLVSCSQEKPELKRISPLYKGKTKSKPGDWLATHKEKYIDIETYVNSRPSRPDSTRKIIYIYKLGENSSAEDSLLQITREYLERVFHLKTRMARTFPISCVPETMRRDLGPEVQINTHFILDTLVNLPQPIDAAVAICFTKYDLYPKDDWNFVFGQAYTQERVGVWSFNRYGDANNPKEFKTVLRRTLKVASHETGHMFSIKHCIRYECNMNGSNSMGETDDSPLHDCPDCLGKLSWNIGFKLEAHFKGLQTFYEKYSFKSEAEFMKANLLKLKEN